MSVDFSKYKQDFPILSREVHPGKKLIYLDSTASTQKPQIVLDAMDDYYHRHNANIHRGVYTISEEATELYENARAKVARFIHAPSARSIVFTRNTTESINLVAFTWGRKNLKENDLVLLTELEHHSNIVPWQILVQEKKIRIEFIPVLPDGILDMNAYKNLLEKKPKLVAFAHMSNVLGTITPVKEMTTLAHQVGAIVLIDGAQSVPHLPVDIQDIDAEFLAFSAHKMCGPTGIGALYGKFDLLNEMPPFLGGGDMIRKVTFEGFSTNDVPAKFEAGTPAIAEAVGFGAAIDYLSSIGMEEIAKHEQEIALYGLRRLEESGGIKVIGPHNQRGGVLAFDMSGIHPHDVAQILDSEGIAVRAGHHCAQPLHIKFGLPATTRASFYLYNSKEDVDSLIKGLDKVKMMFD
ncbi:cysteine desulfurase [Leptolinea tardivitalis]|uniref:cysteine desulfurase n=1 Tax=Leptolinea tardivitalis TaxID=229920 RepID=A0A0P6XQX7_9CHLR|nr:cysteine desulfurase [Leptolinea tardivitalis]KPL74726.1 cysteine desulfurase [Leptolinea tardivitalis]GAP22907.1 cysteine desulfurase, SufSfamily [Leptolinea tardivitalis]